MSENEKGKEDAQDPVVQCVISYRAQAEQAKQTRMQLNRDNFNCYHMRADWSHKKEGQSKEFLAKQSVAVEQLVSFLQQGLVDKGNWWSIEAEAGVNDEDPAGISSDDMFKLTSRQLDKNDIYIFVGDGLKLGALGSLMIAKITGTYVPKYTYRTENKLTLKGWKKALKRDEKRVWQLKLDLVRQEDYYPDPHGGLYECEDIELDLHVLIQIAKDNPNDYDLSVIEDLQASYDGEQRTNKAIETDQDQTADEAYRKRVRVTECWGTFIDSMGNVLHENAVCAIADDKYLIRPPKPNPNWHQQSPYCSSAILRVPKSVWHRALMDAPTKHNRALNEVYNLMLDAGLSSVFGIRQIRMNWLDDPSQVARGIAPGTTLKANATCPPNGKVFERVDTGTEFRQAEEIFNIADKEFNTSAFTNDIRMGALPERSVKATEIVSANQVLTGVFNGVVKMIEDSWMKKILEKSWLTCAQHLNDYDDAEVKALLGDDKAQRISMMAPEDVFAKTAAGRRFKVFGLSTTLNKIQDFRKIAMFLQTIASSPDLLTAFQGKFDATKLLSEILNSLDINVDKIKRSDVPVQQPGAQAPPNLPTMASIAAAGGQLPSAGGNGSLSPGAKNLQNTPNIHHLETGNGGAAMQQGMTVPGGG